MWNYITIQSWDMTFCFQFLPCILMLVAFVFTWKPVVGYFINQSFVSGEMYQKYEILNWCISLSLVFKMATSKKLAAIFDHFSTPQESKDGKVICICKYCGKSISGRIKTTSNFVTHMKVCNLSLSNTYIHVFYFMKLHFTCVYWDSICTVILRTIAGVNSYSVCDFYDVFVELVNWLHYGFLITSPGHLEFIAIRAFHQ
jgi:hypothetical protein